MPWVSFVKQKNLRAKFLNLAALIIILISLPLLVQNVQKRQELRKMAALPSDIQTGSVYPPQETPTPKIEATPIPEPTSSTYYIPGVGIVNPNPTSTPKAPTPTPKPTSSVIYIPGVGIINLSPTPTKKPTPMPTTKPDYIYIPGVGIINVTPKPTARNTTTTPIPTRKPTSAPVYIPGVGIINQTPTQKPVLPPWYSIPKSTPTPTPKPDYIYIPGIGVINQNKTTPTPTVRPPYPGAGMYVAPPTPTPKPNYIIIGGIPIRVSPTPPVQFGMYGTPINRFRCNTDGRCVADINGPYSTIKSCDMFCEAQPTPKPLLGEGSYLTSAKPGETFTDASYTPAEISAMASRYSGEYYTGQYLMEQGVMPFLQQGQDLLSNPWREMKEVTWDPVYYGTALNQIQAAQNINYVMDTMNQSWESPIVQVPLAIGLMAVGSPYITKLATIGINTTGTVKAGTSFITATDEAIQGTNFASVGAIDDVAREAKIGQTFPLAETAYYNNTAFYTLPDSEAVKAVAEGYKATAWVDTLPEVLPKNVVAIELSDGSLAVWNTSIPQSKIAVEQLIAASEEFLRTGIHTSVTTQKIGQALSYPQTAVDIFIEETIIGGKSLFDITGQPVGEYGRLYPRFITP